VSSASAGEFTLAFALCRRSSIKAVLAKEASTVRENVGTLERVAIVDAEAALSVAFRYSAARPPDIDRLAASSASLIGNLIPCPGVLTMALLAVLTV
jgi:hypothetical protein